MGDVIAFRGCGPALGHLEPVKLSFPLHSVEQVREALVHAAVAIEVAQRPVDKALACGDEPGAIGSAARMLTALSLVLCMRA